MICKKYKEKINELEEEIRYWKMGYFKMMDAFLRYVTDSVFISIDEKDKGKIYKGKPEISFSTFEMAVSYIAENYSDGNKRWVTYSPSGRWIVWKEIGGD